MVQNRLLMDEPFLFLDKKKNDSAKYKKIKEDDNCCVE